LCTKTGDSLPWFRPDADWKVKDEKEKYHWRVRLSTSDVGFTVDYCVKKEITLDMGKFKSVRIGVEGSSYSLDGVRYFLKKDAAVDSMVPDLYETMAELVEAEIPILLGFENFSPSTSSELEYWRQVTEGAIQPETAVNKRTGKYDLGPAMATDEQSAGFKNSSEVSKAAKINLLQRLRDMEQTVEVILTKLKVTHQLSEPDNVE
jgi:hypothetical protein